MIRQGKIKYQLWTVLGTRIITVVYSIEGLPAVNKGTIMIEDDEPIDLDSDTLEDIMQKCIEDSKKEEDYKLIQGFDFSTN